MGDGAIFPMLNIGSHTAEYRSKYQPWIDKYIFTPAQKRGQIVKHSDIRPDAGVDIVGDLSDPQFLNSLRQMRFRSVLCANLLEHVLNREEIARTLTEVVAPGCFLLVSCPYKFPFHPDPIDTMFRPTPDELAALFPGTSVIHRDILKCGTLISYSVGRFLGSPLLLAKSLVKRGGDKHPCPNEAPSSLRYGSWLFRQFQESCIVLQKE